jgi:hypothetical protein
MIIERAEWSAFFLIEMVCDRSGRILWCFGKRMPVIETWGESIVLAVFPQE